MYFHRFSHKDFFQIPTLKRFKPIMTFLLCMSCFLISLPCMSYSGLITRHHFTHFYNSSLPIGAFVFQIMDEYGGGMSVMWIAIFEVIGIMWFYGANNFAKVSYCLTLLQYYSCNLFSGFELYAQYFHGGLLGLVQVNHPCKLGPTVNTFIADIMSWSSSGPSSRSYS